MAEVDFSESGDTHDLLDVGDVVVLQLENFQVGSNRTQLRNIVDFVVVEVKLLQVVQLHFPEKQFQRPYWIVETIDTLKFNHSAKPVQRTERFHSLDRVVTEVEGAERSQLEVEHDVFDLIVVCMNT